MARVLLGLALLNALLGLAACRTPSTPNPSTPSTPGAPSDEELLQQIKKGGYRGGSGGQGCDPAPIEIFVQADARLNLSESGRPMPVEVRALLLRARETFDHLDFEALWRDAGKSLGNDLVASASLTVYPGKLKIYPIRSAPNVAFIALVAIFRRPQGAGWKYVVDIREQNRRCASEDLHTIVHAQLRGNRIGKPD